MLNFFFAGDQAEASGKAMPPRRTALGAVFLASLLPLAAHADVVIPATGFMSLSSGGLRAH